MSAVGETVYYPTWTYNADVCSIQFSIHKAHIITGTCATNKTAHNVYLFKLTRWCDCNGILIIHSESDLGRHETEIINLNLCEEHSSNVKIMSDKEI